MTAKLTGPVVVLAPTTGRRDIPPRRDVRVAERLADVPDGATVVLPAHGVDPRTAADTRARAAAGSLDVVDATCPLVARAQATARRFAVEATNVVVIGGAGHAAVPSVAGQAPGSRVVTSVDDVDELVLDASARVAFVVSPGLAVEDAGVLAAHLRSRFAGTVGQHPDEYCYAASDRRAAVRSVASSSELTLVLGAPDATDTRVLLAVAAATGDRVEQLDDLDRLRPEWLRQTASVGIVAGATTRPGLAGELVEVLSGLGPVGLAHRHVTTEVRSAVSAAPVTARRAS